jgi:transposase-like protein
MDKREQFLGVNSIKFNRAFQTDTDCYAYLAAIKWCDDNSYHCKKCGHDNYCKGKKPYSRRCTHCNYDESPTAGTMFDKCKFSLLLAFHIAFKISTKKKGMSSLELSKEFELRPMTCWKFKWKIQQSMQSSMKHLLTGTVHVDEFYIGEYEEGKQGRSSTSKKRLVIIALEILSDGKGVGRAYAQVIDNASAEAFMPFFKTYISPEAHVVTDEWTGYLPLKKEYPNLEQIPSKNGANFLQLHQHIANIKGWLRGIHHHCTKDRLQGYLDEYHFRYNRRTNMNSIFDVLMRRMVICEPKRLDTSKERSAT